MVADWKKKHRFQDQSHADLGRSIRVHDRANDRVVLKEGQTSHRGQIFQTVGTGISACIATVSLYFVLKSNNSLPRVSVVMYVSGGIFLLLIGIIIGRRLGPALPNELSKATKALPDPTTLVLDSDPRVYLVEIREQEDSQGLRTVFVVENRGGSVAHDVHIQSLKLGYRTVNFAPVDSIAVGGKGEILPWPEQVGPNKNNLLIFLDEDSEMKARAEHKGPPEFYNFPLELTHANFSRKRKFSVSILVTYKIQSHLRSRLRNEKESGFFQIVSHSGFKLLS